MKLPKGNPCDWIRTAVSPGDTVIDGGANHGVFTIAAAETVGLSGCVVAVEPDPRCAEAMRKLADYYRQVRYVAAALEIEGVRLASLTLGQHPEQSSLLPHAVKHATGQETVDVVALNDLARGPVAAIKLDLQGGEPNAVLGGASLLTRCPKWCVELWPFALRQQFEFLLWLFAEHDYAVHSFADGYPQVDYDDLIAWGETCEPHTHCNVIFQR